MSDEEPSRLESEIELLTAIYPDQATYTPKSREVKFVQDHASLQLRIPDTYPETGLPEVITATDETKNDVRTETKNAIQALNLQDGEEVLDAMISVFQQIISNKLETSSIASAKSTKSIKGTKDEGTDTKKTVIIWLHHLLNTNKRKLALSPSPPVSGITKPGYPGVLIYAGPARAVSAHVNELKAQNWQAFQVRFEEEICWRFAHGEGVREVESMADVVKLLEIDGKDASEKHTQKGCGQNGRTGGEGQKQKDEFLKAVGIK